MKQKLLLVLGFMLVTLGLQAETVTLSFANTDQRVSQDGEKQVWANGVITFTNEKASSSNAVADYSNPVRLYQGSSIAIDIESGYEMTEILIVSNGTAKYKTALENSLTEAGYSYTNSGNNYTVTLTAATKFKIDKLTGQVRFVSLTVTYGAISEDAAPSTPELTSSCNFLEEQKVTISCPTEGAEIYYTTDGTEPTKESELYSEPFTVDETTTVKAIAVNGNGSSEVATATYTKVELMSIAEAKEAYDAASADTKVFIDLAGAVVTVNKGQYLFIQNETTGINIYASGADYEPGTQFTAGVLSGTSTAYNGMHQISSAVFNNVETTTTTVEPIEVSVADLADAAKYATYEGRYVKLTGVTLEGTTITKGEDTYAAYDRFTLGFAAKYAEATTCDIEGIPACFKTTLQIYPVEITEVSQETGIEAIASENAAPVVYDLLGRRVDNPTSGIFIVNGKKVVIK